MPLTAVTAVFTLTLWLRLAGATASGWLSDRIGRKKPLMISILWYSICNLLAGIAPSFGLLFLFRALLGIGMGAEWPCGAALAMETWPQRSRGLMAGILQASWGIGALLSGAAYALFYDSIGWRGLLIMGVLPALAVVYIRRYVKEPEIWTQNRAIQRERKSEVRAPLFAIFKRNVLGQHAERLLVDGEWLHRRLFDRVTVPDPSAKGPRLQPGDGGIAGDGAKLPVLPLRLPLGLGRR